MHNRSLLLCFRDEGRFDSNLTQLLYQFPALVHLEHYITASNEFSLKIHLWDGWPVAELLDALPQLLVSKNIVASEGDVMHPHYLTTALLKPHWGASGTPFIKTTTFSLSTIALIFSAIGGAAQKVFAEKSCWFRGLNPILTKDLDAACMLIILYLL